MGNKANTEIEAEETTAEVVEAAEAAKTGATVSLEDVQLVLKKRSVGAPEGKKVYTVRRRINGVDTEVKAGSFVTLHFRTVRIGKRLFALKANYPVDKWNALVARGLSALDQLVCAGEVAGAVEKAKRSDGTLIKRNGEQVFSGTVVEEGFRIVKVIPGDTIEGLGDLGIGRTVSEEYKYAVWSQAEYDRIRAEEARMRLRTVIVEDDEDGEDGDEE